MDCGLYPRTARACQREPLDDSGVAYQVAGGSRFFFGAKHRVAVRVELSVIDEDTFDQTSTHVSLTGGFTWRLGGQK